LIKTHHQAKFRALGGNLEIETPPHDFQDAFEMANYMIR